MSSRAIARRILISCCLFSSAFASAKDSDDSSVVELFTSDKPPHERALAMAAAARSLLVEALEKNDFPMSCGYERYWDYLLAIEIGLGDLAAARTTLQTIPESLGYISWFRALGATVKDYARYSLAKAELARNELAEAARIAADIKYEAPSGSTPGLNNDYPDRQGILEAVLHAYLEQKQYDDALKLVPLLLQHVEAQGARGDVRRETFAPDSVVNIFASMTRDGRGDEAIQAVKEILGPKTFAANQAREAITLEQARSGDLPGAMKSAKAALGHLEDLPFLLAKIAVAQAEFGDVDGAKRALEHLESQAGAGEPARALLTHLASAHAQMGDYPGALDLVVRRQSSDEDGLLNALRQIGEVAEKKGAFSDAKVIAQAIPLSYSKVEALQRIAKAQEAKNDQGGAVQTLQEAWRVSFSAPPTEGGAAKQVELLNAMAPNLDGHALATMVDQALAASKSAVEHRPANSEPIQWHMHWGQVQRGLVELEAAHGDVDKAMGDAGTIVDPSSRQSAYQAVAIKCAELGREAAALAAFAAVTDTRLRPSLGHDLVKQWVGRGAIEAARRVIAKMSPQDDPSQLYRSLAVSVIIDYWLARGEIDLAKKELEYAPDLNAEHRSRELQKIADKQMQQGRQAELKTTLKQASDAALAMDENARGARMTQYQLMLLQINSGNSEDALKTLFSADHPDPSTLGAIAGALSEHEEPAKARSLYATAAGRFEKIAILTSCARVLSKRP